jgi:hypothetical protein
MKELFYNQYGHNTVEIKINCLAGDISLHYQLSDNPVQHIWQDLISNATEFNVWPSRNAPTQELINSANTICSKIGAPLIPIEFTQQDLNVTHKFIVEYSSILNDDAHLLNKYIHLLEEDLENKYVKYNANVVFANKDNQECILIKEEYKLWLEPNTKWGELILDYATLGKDWLDISNDDDDITELALQQTITSAACMYFRPEFNFPKARETFFYRWAKKSNINIPLDNLNLLSLGTYQLGKLIIDDTLLDYNPNIGDWYIPNHICKLNWNKDIIGYDVQVKQVKFYTDNKYQEMAVDHALIRPIL